MLKKRTHREKRGEKSEEKEKKREEKGKEEKNRGKRRRELRLCIVHSYHKVVRLLTRNGMQPVPAV